MTTSEVFKKSFGWMESAHCEDADPELFFEAETNHQAIAEAKHICSGCGVKDQCRDWAIRYQEKGVWGETTLSQRKLLRKQYAKCPKAVLDYMARRLYREHEEALQKL